MSNKIKGCIFDLDGTLLDSLAVWERVDQAFFNQHNIEYDDFAKEKLKMMNFDEALTFLKEHYHLAASKEELRQDFDNLVVEEYANNIPLKENAKIFLEKLKKNNIPLCVATSCDRNNALAALKRLGIEDCFDFILTSEELNTSKKEPKIYLQAVKLLGLNVEEVVVFEDLYETLKVAKEAGFNTCGIHDKHNELADEQIKEVCDYYLKNYDELIGD